MEMAISMTKSSKPKKQRKQFYSMPLHKIQKSIAVHLSRALRKEIGMRAIGVRKGDRVKVMRGKHSGKDGKVARVDYKKRQVFVEGIVAKKSSGTEVQLPLQHSNLLLLEMERKDDRRLKNPAKGSKQQEKEEKKRGKKEK